MKKAILLLTVAITLFSCNSNNDLADAYGNFEAIETMVSAEVGGKIVDLNLTEGDRYKMGTSVGLIDTTDLYLKKEQAVAQKQAIRSKINNIDAQISVLKEQRNTLNTEQKRIENLLEGGAATSKQSDDLNAQIRVLEAQIKATETQKQSIYSELNVVQKQIDQIAYSIHKCYLTIPNEGTVLNTFVEKSELVVPGKVLYKLADLDNIILKAYISGSQLNQVKLGQKVKVFIDKNKKDNQEFEGTITWISANAEFTPKIIQTKEDRVDLVYAVKVMVKNNGEIKLGMPAELYFTNSTN